MFPVVDRLEWPSMKRKPSVVIVECSPLLGEALARLLEGLGADVVGCSDSLDAGLDYLKTLQPDFAILDRDATERDILKVVDAARGFSPATRIALLSAHFNRHDVRRACRARVRGCALKSDTVDELRRTMKDVLAGRVVFSQGVRERLVAGAGPGPAGAGVTSRVEQLTERETQVLTHIAYGLSVKEIANVLHLSPKTVDHHKAEIMLKLNIHDRVLLARYAICQGLVSVGKNDPSG